MAHILLFTAFYISSKAMTIKLFSEEKEDISLFDPVFLEELSLVTILLNRQLRIGIFLQSPERSQLRA